MIERPDYSHHVGVISRPAAGGPLREGRLTLFTVSNTDTPENASNSEDNQLFNEMLSLTILKPATANESLTVPTVPL